MEQTPAMCPASKLKSLVQIVNGLLQPTTSDAEVGVAVDDGQAGDEATTNGTISSCLVCMYVLYLFQYHYYYC